MIHIDLDIKMPQDCDVCPLQDEEFHYCHGRLYGAAWECDDYEGARPDWCPLIDKSICKYYLTNGTCAGTRENDHCPCEGNESLCKLRSKNDT